MLIEDVYPINEAMLDALRVELPFYSCTVSAGFPSPAESHMEQVLSLSELLVKHPSTTFFVRVSGDSMIGAGITDGSILVVDRSLTPWDGKIVIAVVNGECTVKRIRYENNRVYLVAENPLYPPIELSAFCERDYWGVVTAVINQL